MQITNCTGREPMASAEPYTAQGPSVFSPDLVPRPGEGRVVERERRVRLGDVTAADRLRFDAVARYLQDIARDDTADAELENAMAWVVRSTVIEVATPPRFQERLCLATWCSGIGGRWAQRRTSIEGEHGGRVEAATVWVHIDPRSGRPARLPARFHELYGAAAGGRGADARLSHPAAPPDGTAAPSRAWPLRATDFDLLGHVNNAAYVETVEEELAGRPELWGASRVELEYRDAVVPGATTQLRVTGSDGALRLWLVSASTDATHFTACVKSRR